MIAEIHCIWITLHSTKQWSGVLFLALSVHVFVGG